MADRIIFFTAGEQATVDELAAIAKLQDASVALYSLAIRRGDAAGGSLSYGSGVEPADYVCGAIPSAYSSVDVIDPDSIPGMGGGGGTTIQIAPGFPVLAPGVSPLNVTTYNHTTFPNSAGYGIYLTCDAGGVITDVELYAKSD